MGTRISGAENVYAAAEKWVQRALRTDDSLFTPGKAIWSRQWLGELRERWLNIPDEPSAIFSEKLQPQLEGSLPEVYQLIGEARYFHLLIATTSGIEKKKQRIDEVLGWSPSPVAIPPELVAGLAPGIANPGMGFLKYKNSARHVGFLIEFVEQWKERERSEPQRLLNDPWAFKDFLVNMRLHSLLLRNNQKTPSVQRQALLHLVFPDTFEAMVSTDHKEKIANTFANLVTQPTKDVDRQLAQIRSAFEPKYGSRDYFFYMDEIRCQWDDKFKSDKPCPPPPCDDPWSPANIKKLAGDLLWEPRELQKIIDGLKDKRQVIFQGPPGTGKTYAAKRIAEWCQNHGGDFQIVQFHPSYSYEDFVQGFRPTLKDGQAGFKLTDGPLRRIAEKAKANPNPGATYILLIDEINRGNVAKVLGELYFLLEYRDEEITLQYSNEQFSLPKNLWFIGTMNTTDRSIALVDAALRRRFYFFGFFPDRPPIKGLLERWLEQNNSKMKWVAGLVDSANEKLRDRDLGIGPSHFMKKDPPLDEDRVRFIWEQAVIPYIEEQLFGDDKVKLEEFHYDRLRQRPDGTASESDDGVAQGEGETNGADGQTEDSAGDAST